MDIRPYKIGDLHHRVFLALRDELFDSAGKSLPISLPILKNRDIYPFDSFIEIILRKRLQDLFVQHAPNEWTHPDFVVSGSSMLLGLEAKKFNRKNGRVPRASGCDYNSTPPCGKIIVYRKNNPVVIRCFYLFACLESDGNKDYVRTLCLCDGNIINEDFELYRQAIGVRQKIIGLGTYQDGMNRCRPMFVFSNPLGIKELDGTATLLCCKRIHNDRLGVAGVLTRNSGNKKHICVIYQDKRDIPSHPWCLKDPFLTPKRDTKTKGRGRFVLMGESGEAEA